MEREKYQSEIRDLQDQLSEMHDELDSAKKSAAADGEREALMTVHQTPRDGRLHTATLRALTRALVGLVSNVQCTAFLFIHIVSRFKGSSVYTEHNDTIRYNLIIPPLEK